MGVGRADEPPVTTTDPVQGPPVPARWRARAAALASLALHVLLWWGMRDVDVRGPSLLPPDDVTVEIVEVAPAAPESAPPVAEQPARESNPRKTQRRDIERAAPSTPAAPPAAPVAETTAPESTLQMRDLTPAPLGGGIAGVPLPSADLLRRAGVGLEVPAAPEGGKRSRGPSAWEQGMQRRARQEAERSLVESGKASPEAFDVMRELERRYQNSRQVAIELGRSEAGRARDAGPWLQRFLGGFADRDPTEEGKPFDPERAFRRSTAAAAIEYASRVCLSYDAEGVPKVELDGASKSPGLDRLALELAVEAADRRRGPGLGHVARACYRVSVRFERVPPVPVLACGLNADLGPECIYPLKELTRTKVQLDGVDLSAQSPGRGR
jgi:hypothetical protein